MSENAKSKKEAHFEDAIDLCGVGYFNFCLIIALIPSVASMVFASSTVSYIMPTAECDLSLTLMKKGLLNAITYIGMIIAAVPWGYTADVFGRKPVLIFGHFVDCAFVLCSAISQSSTQLVIFKFLDGFTICGPFATGVAYASEFHSKRHRSVVVMMSGIIVSFAAVILPIMAYFLLPVHEAYQNEYVKLHNWNFFMFYTAVPSFISGFIYIFLPESPKFLMSQGRSEEALNVFKRVYAINKRSTQDEYPVTVLYDEAPDKTALRLSSIAENESVWKRVARKVRYGSRDFKVIFTKEYLRMTLLVSSLQTCLLLVLNSVRLWLPQVFVTMVKMTNEKVKCSGMCSIIAFNVHVNKLLEIHDIGECVDVHVSGDSYLNNIVVAGTCFLGYILITVIVKYISNKLISLCALAISFVLTIVFYFSYTPLMVLIVASIYITCCGIAATSVISSSVNIFPTTIRTMILISIMTFGRIGSVIGNMLFPALFSLGCSAPFIALALFILAAFILSIFLPNTNKSDLK